MELLNGIIRGKYSIHFLAISWYLITTFISFVFEKFPSTNPSYRIETVLYLTATSRTLQTLVSALILIGLFRRLINDLTKLGILYFLTITVMFSINIATLYDLVGYINSGDCEISYWCMRTYFSK